MNRRIVGLAIVAILTLLTSGGVEAATRIVPDQFPQIQNAIAASSLAGDTVLVRAGTYIENIDYLAKDVVVRSASGPAVTVIDGSQPADLDRGSVVILQGVGNGARLEGFTLRGGTGSRGMIIGTAKAGGGVCVSDNRNLGPVIEGNWIIENHADNGGGVLIAGAVRLRGNRIAGNVAGPGPPNIGVGGGILLDEFDPPVSLARRVISQNEIYGNQATYSGGARLFGGGGPYFYEFSDNLVVCNQADLIGGISAEGHPEANIVEGNTIVFNTSPQGVAAGVRVAVNEESSMLFRNNIVAFNFNGGIECKIYGPGWGTPEFSCNDIEGNNPDFLDDACGDVIGVNGNIREDPMFGQAAGCPPAAGDLCLASGSPLLPENSPPNCGLIGARGLCGQIGIADETPAPAAERNRVSVQPNPFATRTTLVIDLVMQAEIDLRITNALGRVVAEENLGTLHAGRHRWIWDGRDARGQKAPAGVYYGEVQAGGRSLVTRLMILR